MNVSNDLNTVVRQEPTVDKLVVIDYPFTNAVSVFEDVGDLGVFEVHFPGGDHIFCTCVVAFQEKLKSIQISLAYLRLHWSCQIYGSCRIRSSYRTSARPAVRNMRDQVRTLRSGGALPTYVNGGAKTGHGAEQKSATREGMGLKRRERFAPRQLRFSDSWRLPGRFCPAGQT